jgi:hypothetical protein
MLRKLNTASLRTVIRRNVVIRWSVVIPGARASASPESTSL